MRGEFIKMKTLFEILTGFYGRSYERSYAWENSDVEARRKFEQKYPNRKIQRIRRLFSESESPFCTSLSEDGFIFD